MVHEENGTVICVEKCLVTSIIEYAETLLKDLPEIYGVTHMRTTVRFAENIETTEAVNRDLCVISAALHDVGLIEGCDFEHETVDDNHGVRSAVIARTYLNKSGGMEDEAIDIVCTSMAQHCFPGTQTTIYAKILWDCDKLNMFKDTMVDRYLHHWQQMGMTRENAVKRIERAREYYRETFFTEYAQNMAQRYRVGCARKTVNHNQHDK